jgi:hypothetical protein
MVDKASPLLEASLSVSFCHPLILQTSISTVSPIEEFPETEESSAKEDRELKEEKDDQKEEEIPENANTEKISMETLLKVFGGGNEVLDANRFASYLKSENIYAEVG